MSFFSLQKFVLLVILFELLVIVFLLPIPRVDKKQKELTQFSKITTRPKKILDITQPQISAKSVLVTDWQTDEILFEKNSNLKLAPASLTKLATAALVLQRCDKDQVITVPKISTPSGTKMGLVTGEKITVNNLLYGMLLASGNDAANALMLICFGSFEEFLSSVTKFTQKLDMDDTHFTNPSGLPTKNHFSTAQDLLKLTKAALKNPIISQIVAVKEKTVTDVTGRISHRLVNLNKLLDNPTVLGVKTGRTGVGENLIILKEIKGHKVISIVLQSHDRFSDSEKILDWVESAFAWEPALE